MGIIDRIKLALSGKSVPASIKVARPFEPPPVDEPPVRDQDGRILCSACKKDLARTPYGFCLECTEEWNAYLEYLNQK